MKYLIYLSVLLFAFQIAFTQNYQCIKDDATYYFSDGTNFKAIQIDSVVNDGENLVYFNFPTMTDEADPNCYSRFGPSWIGRKISLAPDGDHIFYNKFDEPITINTLKDTGEFWTAYQFTDGNYTIATIAEIVQMEFLGLTDTIKKITFQTYDLNGNPITYPTNDQYLLISKNNGLVRTINFKLFPNHSGGLISNEYCSEYTLCGISDPPLGVQNLTAAQVYNFNVGDEIHTSYSEFWSQDYAYYERFKDIYLQKELSTNTVSYLIHHCGYTEEQIPYTGIFYEYYNDTITRNYYIGEDSVIDFIPEKVIINNFYGGSWEYSVTNCTYFSGTNKLIKTKMAGFYSDFPHDCIYIIASKNSKDLGNDEKYYIEGIGKYHYYFHVADHQESSQPVYFKKGEEEWGTPYTFNCEDFISSINQNLNSAYKVIITPNPMKEWTTISIEPAIVSEYNLMLFNNMGKPIKEYNFFGSEFRIKRDGLPDGIYFYILEGPNGFNTSGKLIMQ